MTPEQEARAARVFDKLLKRYEEILDIGEEVIGPDGQIMLKKPSAAMCGKIQEWLLKHDIGKAPAGSAGGVGASVKRLRASGQIPSLRLNNGGSVPPLSEDDDAATKVG